MRKKEILPVWQPIGYSTYQITNAIAKKYDKKSAHTGVLDPMAEGVIIVLLGKERFNKIKYTQEWKKTYRFKIVLGISTDSYDGMGITNKINLDLAHTDKKTIKSAVLGFEGLYKHKVPLYSAIKVKGKKLFMYPKENLKPPKLPTRKGHIYSIKLNSVSQMEAGNIVKKVLKNLKNIKTGEFRQKEITKNWEKFLKDHKKDLTKKAQILDISAQTSSGVYIRSLSQDICKKLGVPGFVFGLVREKNGLYGKKDSEPLKKIFGRDFQESQLTSQFKS